MTNEAKLLSKELLDVSKRLADALVEDNRELIGEIRIELANSLFKKKITDYYIRNGVSVKDLNQLEYDVKVARIGMKAATAVLNSRI